MKQNENIKMSNIQTIGYLSGYVTSHDGVMFQKNPNVGFQDKKLFGFRPKIWNQIYSFFAGTNVENEGSVRLLKNGHFFVSKGHKNQWSLFQKALN